MTTARKPTQRDVAKLAGVSTAVVSRVLNPDGAGTVRVGPEAEARVKRAVEQLGYVPNPVARNLATGRTHLIGVFTYEPIFPTAQRDFYFPFLVGIERAAEERGLDLLLFTGSSGPARARRAFRDGVNRMRLADGALLLGRTPDRKELARLADEGYPMVYIGRREVDGHRVSFVAADYAGGTADLATYLVELGHRRLAYLGVPDPEESATDRERGYRAALERIGLARTIHRIRKPAAAVDAHLVRDLHTEGFTAVLVESDAFARRLLAAAAVARIDVPRQLSFAVLGDPLDPATVDPGWTTFRIPREEMGSHAFDSLVRAIEDPSSMPRQVYLPCTFVPGSTTVRPGA